MVDKSDWYGLKTCEEFQRLIGRKSFNKDNAYNLVMYVQNSIDMDVKDLVVNEVRKKFANYRNIDHLVSSATFFGSSKTGVIADEIGSYRVIDCNTDYEFCNKNDVLFITFGKVSSHVDHVPFGFPFLVKQGYKHIHVATQRRTSYQKLSLETFYDLFKDIIPKYEHVFFYGASLGAYAAVYYASLFQCFVIAGSPRLPIFPENRKFSAWKENSNWDEIEMAHKDLSELECAIKEVFVIFDNFDPVDSNFVFNYIFKLKCRSWSLDMIKGSGHATLAKLLAQDQLKSTINGYVQSKVRCGNI